MVSFNLRKIASNLSDYSIALDLVNSCGAQIHKSNHHGVIFKKEKKKKKAGTFSIFEHIKRSLKIQPIYKTTEQRSSETLEKSKKRLMFCEVNK